MAGFAVNILFCKVIDCILDCDRILEQVERVECGLSGMECETFHFRRFSKDFLHLHCFIFQNVPSMFQEYIQTKIP